MRLASYGSPLIMLFIILVDMNLGTLLMGVRLLLGPIPDTVPSAQETLTTPPGEPAPIDHDTQVPESPASPEYVPLDGTIADSRRMPPPRRLPLRRGCPRIQYHPLVAHGSADEALFEALGGHEPWE